MTRTYYPFAYWPLRSLPGWHWPNIGNGHRVYRGVGGLSNVDFSAPVAFAQADATSIALVGTGHAALTRYTYVVRPVAGNGWLETPDGSCAVEFETGADGDWLGARPAPVEWIRAEIKAAGGIELSWSWRRPYGGSGPMDFCLYHAGVPAIVAGDPQATATYTADGRYSHTFSLSGGQTYYFAVTARDGEGVESHLSDVIGPYLADATPPDAPTVSVSTTF
jgi:hypothetical protein